MKGKIILTDITDSIEGMQVVYEGNTYIYNGIGYNGDMGKFANLEGYPYNIDYSELKQIAVEYDIEHCYGDEQEQRWVSTKEILSLHPDDWKVAIPIIGHEVEFKEVNKDMYSKHIGPAEIVAKLSLPTPVRTIEDIPKGLRKRYPKDFDGTKPPTETAKLLSEIMEDVQKLGLYDTEETWDDIKTKYKKITNRGILTDEELSLFEFLEDYLPPKRKIYDNCSILYKQAKESRNTGRII